METGCEPTIPHSAEDIALMDVAITLAKEAAARGEVPVGAVIAGSSGRIVAQEANRCVRAQDPLAHAEMLAILRACQELGTSVLRGCTLAVTLEPCAMCAGAILHAGISRVLFGAWEPKTGCAGSAYDLLRDERMPFAAPEVHAGVRAETCARLLQDFFASLRNDPVH